MTWRLKAGSGGRLAPRRVREGGALALVLLLSLLFAPVALALSNPADMLPDPAQEERARALGREIRCMVCQNQSIEDSEVSLARDLRLIVRERIVAGDDDAGIKAYLHARYGDFVLLRPPFTWGTAALWATPVVALLFGVTLILLARRRAAQPVPPAPLTEEERRRLAALDADGGGTRNGPSA